MKNTYRLLIMAVSVVLLSGCAVKYVPLNPQAENIAIIDSSAYAYHGVLTFPGCQLKGQVIANNILLSKPINAQQLTENEINIIKNKALVLGANKVIIQHNTVIFKDNDYIHAVIGDAYYCYMPHY